MDKFGNLGFDSNMVFLLSVGTSGATASPGPKCLFERLYTVISYDPSVVYLHISERDLRSTHTHRHQPITVAREICRTVNHLSAHIPTVYVTGCCHFPLLLNRNEQLWSVINL